MNDEFTVNRGWFLRNLANTITIFGILLCAILTGVVCFYPERTDWILELLSGIFATDYLDGKTARRFGESRLGAALDRIRDKHAIFNVLIFLIRDGRVHISYKMVSVPMGIIEAALIYYMVKEWRNKIDIATAKVANKRGPGQIKMFLQSATMFLVVANVIVEPQMGYAYHVCATVVLNVLFAFAIFFGAKSFINHRNRCNSKRY